MECVCVKICRSFFYVSYLWALLGCSKSTDFPYKKSESFIDIGNPAEKAFQVFSKECLHIANDANDLEYIKAESGLALPKTPDYGWNKGVAVELKVKRYPATGDAMRMASGHVCTFYMGGRIQTRYLYIKVLY